MQVYVDQSGKVEDTARPTVVAFTNGATYVIKVAARTKRQLQERFRRQGAIRLFIYRTFAALVFLLIRRFLPQINQVVIDTEYPGQEKLIKEVILEFLRREALPEPSIVFRRIGNRPKVHYAAYDVFAKKKKEDRRVALAEIVNLAIKKDRGRKRLKDA